jgi:hypothetical protein
MSLASITSWWEGLWFSASVAHNHGIARILFMLGLMWYLASRGFRIKMYATFPRDCYHPPLPLRILPRSIFPPPRAIAALGFPLMTLALAGVFTRASLLAVAIWWLYMEGVHNSFGFFNHVTSVPIVILLASPLFPGVDAVSVDRLLSSSEPLFGSGPVEVWPARLVLVLLSIGYFTAGLSKVRFGNSFLNGETLRYYLSGPTETLFLPSASRLRPWKGKVELETFTYNFCKRTTLGRWIASSPLAVRVVCILTFSWEITFPVVLFSDLALPFYLAFGVIFHLGVLVAMRLDFMLYVAAYAFCVSWNDLLRRIGAVV